MIPAILLVAGIALIAGLVLAVASVVMAVPRDELVDKLRDCLPGANCGACGYSGCDGYAAAMAHEGAPVGLCPPGGEDTLEATSKILGTEGGEVVKMVANIHCGGCDQAAPRAFVYDGIRSCRAASQLYGGDKICPYGCLGYGDCVASCDYHAIEIRNGIAFMIHDECVACGKCVRTCPKGLIELRPLNVALINCHSHDKGAAVRKYCSAGCIACTKCVKTCPHGAITMENNLAQIDFEKCTGCGACVEVCPAHCIEIPLQKK